MTVIFKPFEQEARITASLKVQEVFGRTETALWVSNANFENRGRTQRRTVISGKCYFPYVSKRQPPLRGSWHN